MNKKRMLIGISIISFLIILIFKYNDRAVEMVTNIYRFSKEIIKDNLEYLGSIDYKKVIEENSLNAREQAVSIWGIIILIIMVINNNIRSSLRSVIKSAFNIRFIAITMFYIVYNAIIVFWLNRIGLWDIALLKDTIIWFIFSGIVIVFKSILNKGKNNYFKNVILDNIKLVIVIQFMLSEYTMNFFFEFISVPIFFLLAGTIVISENKSEYKEVKKILSWIQNILLMMLVINSFKGAINDINNLGTYNNLLKIIVPSILSILSILPAYLVALYTSYEEIFMRVNFYKRRTKSECIYLKYRILVYCNISLNKVNELWEKKNKELLYLTDKEEIKQMLK